MKASKTTLTGLVAGGAALLFGTSLANAAFVLTLDDLGTVGVDVIVVDSFDGGVGTVTAKGASNTVDGDATAGVVSFSGAVGAFSINITSGISDPNIGPNASPGDPWTIDLISANVSGAAGTLQIMLTDTGFTGPVGRLISNIGGTTGGTVTAQQSFDPTDTEFGMPVATTINHGPFAGGAFSDDAGLVFPGHAGTFSLTESVTIVHTQAGQITSFDFESKAAPEPASLGMLGLGLVGLGFAARRRRKTT